MDNNGIFRRIRYALDLNNAKMVDLFELANHKVDNTQIKSWLKKEDDPALVEMPDVMLATFLNGLIIDRRGKREGAPPVPEKELTNNIVLKKLKIALNLKTDDMLEIFESIDKSISAHELSAFFRNPNQSKYRTCNDQYLRFFLKGVQQKYRGSDSVQEPD